MYLVGQKVITPDGEQGYVYEITKHNEIVVALGYESPDSNKFVKEIYQQNGLESVVNASALVLCDDQRPMLADVTPFGIVESLSMLAHGIIQVEFEGTDAGALWISEERACAAGCDITMEDAHWINAQNAEKAMEYFEFEYVDGKWHPKGLRHYDTAWECTLQALLPCGRVMSCAASINGNGQIESIELDKAHGHRIINSVTDLRGLGVTRVNLCNERRLS